MVAPDFPSGQGQKAPTQKPQSDAPVIASPASGETVDLKFLVLVKGTQYTAQYSSALLTAEMLTPAGWQSVTLPLPKIKNLPSVQLGKPTATTLPKGEYRIQAQGTDAVYGGQWTGWRFFKVQPFAETVNDMYQAAQEAGKTGPAQSQFLGARAKDFGLIEVAVANRSDRTRAIAVEIRLGETVVGRERVNLAARGRRTLAIHWNPPPGISGPVELVVYEKVGIVRTMN
jgi:hypothetical protein